MISGTVLLIPIAFVQNEYTKCVRIWVPTRKEKLPILKVGMLVKHWFRHLVWFLRFGKINQQPSLCSILNIQ